MGYGSLGRPIDPEGMRNIGTLMIFYKDATFYNFLNFNQNKTILLK
jgi:hypothetical protein